MKYNVVINGKPVTVNESSLSDILKVLDLQGKVYGSDYTISKAKESTDIVRFLDALEAQRERKAKQDRSRSYWEGQSAPREYRNEWYQFCEECGIDNMMLG